MYHCTDCIRDVLYCLETFEDNEVSTDTIHCSVPTELVHLQETLLMLLIDQILFSARCNDMVCSFM